MKKNLQKILAATVALTSISLASQALAKTEGSYVGVNLSRVNSSHQYERSGVTASNFAKFDNSATGFGVNYKYAISLNNFFLAPGIFYEKLGTKADSIGDEGDTSISVNSRYGAKLDFGYDIADNFAMYLTGGLANVSYKVDWADVTGQKKSGNKVGAILGIGANYYPHKNISLNLEYNFQTLDLATPDNGGVNQAKTDISTIQIGAAYHF